MTKNQKQEDIRIQKTNRAIKEAFRFMVCEMPADKITVKELSERAHIHRKTFYLHYSCLEELYQEMLREACEDYYMQVNQLPENMPMKEINRSFQDKC